jgi:MYXO-CTERM domain-containing protein
MRLRSLPSLISFAGFLAPAPAAAQIECSELGFALVEHSCFHATFGPFVGVTAANSETDLEQLPRLDDVHTFYEIELPAPLEQNSLSYRVATDMRVGEWAFFHDPDVHLEVLDEAGKSLPVILEHVVPDCAELPHVSVFHLDDQRYRIQLGPGNQSRCVLVIENLSDFIARTGRDQDGDGFGDPRETKLTLCTPDPGYATNISDCDDARADVNPKALERCDGVDQNCNGIPDDEDLPCRAGSGACESSGTWHCSEAGEPPICEVASPRQPTEEVCDGEDSDCDGTDDLNEEELCPSDDTPRCVNVLGEVRCGCTEDVDCGSAASGRVCDETLRVCVDGCVELSGRNHCPPGTKCTSSDPAELGRCVAAGSASDSGAIGKPDGGAGATDSTSVAPAGCGCVVGGLPPASPGKPWSFGLLLLGVGAMMRPRGHR